jgi:thioester reductase-like protein
VFWRVEGSLLNLSTVRPTAFFAWNAQSFLERWVRRGTILAQALLRPFLYSANRIFATRFVHTVLRGISRDRLDLLGEEYFQYRLKPRLKPQGVEQLKALVAAGNEVVLVSQGLDHIMRPLAEHFGVKFLISNRLDFRDGIATGRLLDPVIRPRGAFARITGSNPDGRLDLAQLCRDLGYEGDSECVLEAITPAQRCVSLKPRPIVRFEDGPCTQQLSVRKALAGKNILLIGTTGFIGKVWLANLLNDLPEIGKIYLLIRRQKSTTPVRRFEKLVEESPVFDGLHQRYGADFPRFMAAQISVVEGDVSQPGLGMDSAVRVELAKSLDLVVNSSGLTDFNPDLRDALSSNVESIIHLLDFIRESDHGGLLHLSTCYVAGALDGRVNEELRPNYTPLHVPFFDAEKERKALQALIHDAQARAESADVTAELRQQARTKSTAAKDLSGAALENQVRKNRIRWLREHLTEAGARRAKELGWPNTYTLTKSLAESLIATRGKGLPIAIVRPSIVETSVEKPFLGWNEGINTSASLSYLLGTYFRQLPSNERKRLDIIPVDQVSRGMTLIAAAIIERCHRPVYQLATSVTNPCDMRRSIEVTCLAHRKHYRAQEGLEHWLRLRFETIPVSKERYNRLSAPAQRAIVKQLQRLAPPATALRSSLVRTERSLERVEKLIELFEPFILHNEHDFEADNIELLSHALAADERADFGYDTRSIDWWDYWINVHIPALRKWTYPLIEGRPLEFRARRSFRMSGSESDQTIRTGTGASWQFS